MVSIYKGSVSSRGLGFRVSGLRVYRVWGLRSRSPSHLGV